MSWAVLLIREYGATVFLTLVSNPVLMMLWSMTACCERQMN